MKRLMTLSVALALSTAIPLGQAQSMKGMDMKDMDMKMEKKGKGEKAAGQSHTGSGKVTKVDPATNSVTIAHEPVSTMNWPAMTMTFKVKDKKMLDKAKSGEKVEFTFVQSGKDYTITDIK
jgi:Cu(I)/Ag(I) efflux system protein CusF